MNCRNNEGVFDGWSQHEQNTATAIKLGFITKINEYGS